MPPGDTSPAMINGVAAGVRLPLAPALSSYGVRASAANRPMYALLPRKALHGIPTYVDLLHGSCSRSVRSDPQGAQCLL